MPRIPPIHGLARCRRLWIGLLLLACGCSESQVKRIWAMHRAAS